MTLTASSDQIVIESTVIDAFILDDTHPLTLTVTTNCGTPVVIEIAAEDLEVDDTFIVTPAMLDATITEFAQGVYRFVLKYAAPTTQTDTYNLYWAPGIECKLLDYFAAKGIDCLEKQPCGHNEHFWLFAYHYLLSRMNTCTAFTYQGACNMWTMISNILETTDDGDCGCN